MVECRMVKDTIRDISVNKYEKRRERNKKKHYVYVVNITWSDDVRSIVFRKYSEFYKLHMSLLSAFPKDSGARGSSKRILPFLPGKVMFGRSRTKKVAEKRLGPLHEYCKTLVTLPKRIRCCSLVTEFFTPRRNDIHLDGKSAGKTNKQGRTTSASSGEDLFINPSSAVSNHSSPLSSETSSPQRSPRSPGTLSRDLVPQEQLFIMPSVNGSVPHDDKDDNDEVFDSVSVTGNDNPSNPPSRRSSGVSSCSIHTQVPPVYEHYISTRSISKSHSTVSSQYTESRTSKQSSYASHSSSLRQRSHDFDSAAGLSHSEADNLAEDDERQGASVTSDSVDSVLSYLTSTIDRMHASLHDIAVVPENDSKVADEPGDSDDMTSNRRQSVQERISQLKRNRGVSSSVDNATLQKARSSVERQSSAESTSSDLGKRRSSIQERISMLNKAGSAADDVTGVMHNHTAKTANGPLSIAVEGEEKKEKEKPPVSPIKPSLPAKPKLDLKQKSPGGGGQGGVERRIRNTVVAKADFDIQARSSVRLTAGQRVTVLDKDEGWWYVDAGEGQQGWAPAGHLNSQPDDHTTLRHQHSQDSDMPVVNSSPSTPTTMAATSTSAPPPTATTNGTTPTPSDPTSSATAAPSSPRSNKPVYLARSFYQAAEPSETSMEGGEYVVVIEKQGSGWWYVESKAGEGWVPSHYLMNPMKAAGAGATNGASAASKTTPTKTTYTNGYHYDSPTKARVLPSTNNVVKPAKSEPVHPKDYRDKHRGGDKGIDCVNKRETTNAKEDSDSVGKSFSDIRAMFGKGS